MHLNYLDFALCSGCYSSWRQGLGWVQAQDSQWLAQLEFGIFDPEITMVVRGGRYWRRVCFRLVFVLNSYRKMSQLCGGQHVHF
jgi:hypothetical protein